MSVFLSSLGVVGCADDLRFVVWGALSAPWRLQPSLHDVGWVPSSGSWWPRSLPGDCGNTGSRTGRARSEAARAAAPNRQLSCALPLAAWQDGSRSQTGSGLVLPLLPGAVYQITSRGNARGPIAVAADDRETSSRLWAVVERYSGLLGRGVLVRQDRSGGGSMSVAEPLNPLTRPRWGMSPTGPASRKRGLRSRWSDPPGERTQGGVSLVLSLLA